MTSESNDQASDNQASDNKSSDNKASDNNAGRRPPTIELAATEVDDAAAKPAAGEAETASAPGAEEEPAAANAQAAATSSGRLRSHIVGVIVGAAVMAVILAAALAALWFTGFIPAPDAALTDKQAANTPAPPPRPATPLPNSAPAQPTPPTAAAQNAAPPPDVSARLDKIERAIETPRNDPALGNRIAAAEAQAKSVGEAIAALQRRVDEIAATGQSAAKQADAALNTAEAAKSASEAANKTEVQRSDLDALASRFMVLESAVNGLAAITAPLAAGADDRAARFAVAAATLRASVERGAPYQAELAALRALGLDDKAAMPLAPFAASGVPSTAALARELEALTPKLEEAAEPTSRETSFIDRLKENAQKLVRITPADAPAGNDPASVIARIRFDAARRDVATALADIGALPEPAKSLAAGWSKKAATGEAALAASKQIAADAVAALVKSPAR
jgi:hypothetical protein